MGIVGNGFVGSATRQLINGNLNVLIHDKDPARCDPPGTTIYNLVQECNIIFICVPTPSNPDGSCDTSIVEGVVADIRKTFEKNRIRRGASSWMGGTHSEHAESNNIDQEPFIVVRSTVPPGTCDRLRVYTMPEFLTEARYLEDFRESDHWLIGLLSEPDSVKDRNRRFINLLREIHDSATNPQTGGDWISPKQFVIRSNREVEMAKYARNGFLATKVSFFNEMEEYCRLHGIDYDNVQEMAGLDPRIGTSHMQVPGPDGQRGFGGSCFPKDIASLRHMIDMTENMEPFIVDSVYWRNKDHDRHSMSDQSDNSDET